MADRDRLSARATPRASSQGPTRAPVWVLEDQDAPRPGPATWIAQRLGLPFRRVPLRWNWLAPWAGLAPVGAAGGGSLLGVAGAATPRRLTPPPGPLRPLLVVSAGVRASAVALWLKANLGCRTVHCVLPGVAARVGGWVGGGEHGPSRDGAGHDVLVAPHGASAREGDHLVRVLGLPHEVGPASLREAIEQWDERLDHLPRPRVALLVGGRAHGTDMEPARAHALGRAVARIAGERGGSVLASTSRRTGREAAEALAAGIAETMHLLYRWGEPGENPYLGFLALADAVVVTADSATMIAQACATAAPVFVACPELAGSGQRRLLARFLDAGQARMLDGSVSPYPRAPLDEAGRVAQEVRRRLRLPVAPG